MSMIRWEPAKDLMSLRQALDKLFEESFVRPSGFNLGIGGAKDIPVDIYQTDNDVVVKANLPGIKPEEADISITGNVLTIKAERKEEKEEKNKDYVRKENYYGLISRSIDLPVDVTAEKSNAVFENGILILTLPKIEAIKPKQIKVQVKSKST